MNFDQATIKQKLKQLPLCPGVYLMKNQDGEIIYVGKSKHLKNRVSQYFMHSKNHSPKTIAMVSNVYDFDYMVTDTETEALVLECNLIKKYKPRYNILLKDDKQYPYIKMTIQEAYPRIYMTRKIIRDGARYFGPYMSSVMVRDALEIIRHVFKVRSCTKNLPRDIGKSRPCLYYHINQCSAPCAGKISQEEYKEVFDQIAAVLEGKYLSIIEPLKEKMKLASDKLEFEAAARYRDRIESLQMLGEKQKMISTKENNRDIIGLYQDEEESCVQIFYMRDGKISGSEYFVFDQETADSELLSGFVKQYYFNATMLPKEILLPASFEDAREVQAWLSEKAGHKISLLFPQRGEKASLVEMVNKNAEESLQKYRFRRNREQLRQNDILSAFMKVLNLSAPPHRIECYDISNISGTQSIGACVVYKNARESKKDYRKFHIKTVEGSNDYESMREVIFRRMNRAYEESDAIAAGKLTMEKAKFLPLPDLILLDGGKGHVSAVRLLMETLGESIPVFGMVKDDQHRTRGLTDEHEELPVDTESNLFRFLCAMQEEVHRFAITAFRKKHEAASMHSELENIPGIGPAKRSLLMKTFASVPRIKQADFQELSIVVGKTAAQNIINYFHTGDEKNES
ncbi:excinuclease ABC subunit UvrC [Ructibacterium gallinarum]|uniref:UvrABC system protein C n=1 Tax=Ructibacterium gallinarum TaxID=2779355 RepID=A0A9D5R8N8_9FIRM|nr:excinuclease ABC subunit UvrC [Ructibacterium gallinarum]MBE5039624.1 excinuclease ABC subunit UvrC [Ructibacterium gallinarum]